MFSWQHWAYFHPQYDYEKPTIYFNWLNSEIWTFEIHPSPLRCLSFWSTVIASYKIEGIFRHITREADQPMPSFQPISSQDPWYFLNTKSWIMPGNQLINVFPPLQVIVLCNPYLTNLIDNRRLTRNPLIWNHRICKHTKIFNYFYSQLIQKENNCQTRGMTFHSQSNKETSLCILNYLQKLFQKSTSVI